MNPGQNTVLLIEDDIHLLDMYKIKFIKEGFNILTAADGETGLELFSKNKIDIVLLDMLLPKLPGPQFLQKLRALPAGKDALVLVLSNHTDKESANQAYTLGVKEYLSKAMFTPEQIVEKVKKYLTPQADNKTN